MSTYSVADARAHFTTVLDQAQHEAVMIERHGKQAAVVISPERYELLIEAFEDAEDAQSFDDAMAEEGANIPWDQVKVDLGWV
jgi:prevent-host-death family protein